MMRWTIAAGCWLLICLMIPTDPANGLLRWTLGQARAQRVRSMREFAESEITVPTGRFAGTRFRTDRQPFIRHWFDAVDAGGWQEHIATGPSQSGKTLSCFVIPTLYHLFELRETVIVGVPSMDMCNDKWREDLEPVIELNPAFRDLLPVKGEGSRGGRVKSAITFRHGATLKFMSGGGGDKRRAGFTARTLIVTEAEGFAGSGENSEEADKLKQLYARTRSYGDQKRIYLECTVTTNKGLIWQKYLAGTASELRVPCPGCRAYVLPERPHLVGWQEAADEEQARAESAFCCPSCGVIWSAEEREAAVRSARLVHRGQEISREGHISGERARTRTLGFRWNALHNLFVTPGDIGADEWNAAREVEEENAQREMLQFVWAFPYEPPELELVKLNPDDLARRIVPLARGLAPHETDLITVGIDIGKYRLHYFACAWWGRANGHVLEYGEVDVRTAELGFDNALYNALNELADVLMVGWPIDGSGEIVLPKQVWIDSAWADSRSVVYQFVRECEANNARAGRFRPIRGYGAGQRGGSRYNRPAKAAGNVKHVGDGWHVEFTPDERCYRMEVDADHWKSWLHARLSCPLWEAQSKRTPGAMSFYAATGREHREFARHLTAERQEEEFIPGRGTVVRWAQVRRNNHWFDGGYLSCAAANLCGIQAIPAPAPAPAPSRPSGVRPGLQRADGRSWISSR